MGDTPPLLTKVEFAKALHVSTRMLNQMIDEGQVAVIPVGKRLRIPSTEIARLQSQAAPRPRQPEDDR